MVVSLRENKLMVGFVTILVVLMGFIFSGSVYASTPNPESDFEFDSSTGRITGYVGESTDVVIPSTIGGVVVTSIRGDAFYDNNLTSVVIPDSVTSIGNYAFQDNNLTSVTIGNGVTSIGVMAFSSNNLTSVVIPDSVTSIGNFAFRDNNLTSVTIGNGVTSIGINPFVGNPNLENIEVDENNDNYTSTENNNAVYTKDGKTLISGTKFMSDDILEGVTSIGDSAFYDNELTSVTIPDSVTSIGSDAFRNNDLTSVTIPGSVTSIGSWAFQGNNLTSVVIPDSVTSIGNQAFRDNELTSVVIPDSVTSIESSAFRNNSSLETVIIKGEPTIAGTTTFSRTSNVSGNTNVTLYGIPNSSVQTYADANGHPFKDLASFVEDTLEGQHNILANILSGGLHLFASPIVNFGEILLGTTKETHYTGFEENLAIHDLRGNHEGWSLTVSATTMANSEHVMPTGSLTLGDLTGIDSQVGAPTTDINEYTVIDDGSDVLVANAEENTGMGVTSVNFGENALGLVVDPKTTRATEYESTLTWTLVATPHIN